MTERLIEHTRSKTRPWIPRSFSVLMFLAVLTGFGQMPIFKRYYVADIPGLSWLAQFYVTHFLHYLVGTLILAMLGYLVVDDLFRQGRYRRLTSLRFSRGLVLGGILLTGVLLALKNFDGYLYPAEAIIVLDLVHLGLVMAWLLLSLIVITLKQEWFRKSKPSDTRRRFS